MTLSGRVRTPAERERALATEDLADLPAGDHQGRHHQRVQRDRGLDPGHRRPDVLGHRGDGDVHERADRARVHRFDQMMIEARLLRPSSIDVLPPAGDRDHGDVLAPGLLADAAAGLEAVDPRQAEVHEHDVGTQALGGGKSLHAIVGHERLVSLILEQDLQ